MIRRQMLNINMPSGNDRAGTGRGNSQHGVYTGDQARRIVQSGNEKYRPRNNERDSLEDTQRASLQIQDILCE